MVNFVFTAAIVEKLLSVRFSEAELAENEKCQGTIISLGYTVEHLLWTPSFMGNLHSGDSKFGPGKMFTESLYLLPLLKGYFYSGERNTFSGSRNPGLTSIQGTP